MTVRNAALLIFFIIAATPAAAQQERFVGRAAITEAATIRLLGGPASGFDEILVDLYGLEAPSRHSRCQTAAGEVWECGKAAIAALRRKADGEQLSCELVAVSDRRGRAAICKMGRVELNRWVASEGWARSFDGEQYASQEENARRRQKGVWKAGGGVVNWRE